MIPLGWGIFGWLNKFLFIPLYNVLTDYFSVGLAIILMTIIVRLLLSPIVYKSYISQAKMKVLRPEINEINEKYKEPMKRQQETMDLYRKAGVNPLSGCIPALLQLPVFLALFNFFPTEFGLRQKAFLWADDLSSYDAVLELPFSIPFYGSHVSLFSFLASVAILIYSLMTMSQSMQQQQPGMPNMKFLIYLSPIMMLFFFNNYASGLSLYYFVSNLLTIFIMLAIKYWIIDEKKIHAQIEENKKKTGFVVLNTPQTTDGELLVEMLKPFKGKVVLMDMWATWCGPCLAANEQMEPLKAEFADKDVIFLYLAGENSPENTWKNMIPNIKGQHYRVNKNQ